MMYYSYGKEAVKTSVSNITKSFQCGGHSQGGHSESQNTSSQ